MMCRVRSLSSDSSKWVCLLLAISIPGTLAGQTQTATISLFESITSDLETIRSAEQQKLPEDKIGYLWANLASEYERQDDFHKAEDAFNRSLSLLAKVPSGRANYGRAMENLGTLYIQYSRIAEAENCYKKALAIGIELGERMEIDAARQHLAEIALAKHNFKQAAREAKEVYADFSENRLADRSIEIAALLTSSYANCSRHRCVEGSQDAERAMHLVREYFPGDSIALADVLMANGYAQWHSGLIEDAGHSMQEGLRILRLNYSGRHPIMMAAMYEYRDYLKSARRSDEAQLVELQLAKVKQDAQGLCSSCSVSVHSLR